MTTYNVSVTRTIREDAIIQVEAENEVEAEANARHEVRIGTAEFHRANGGVKLAVDWVEVDDQGPHT